MSSRPAGPWNSGTGWPRSTPSTVGTASAPIAWASCGLASASSRATRSRPSSSAASATRSAATWVLTSLHEAHSTSTTGTVDDCCTTAPKPASSVMSTTGAVGAPGSVVGPAPGGGVWRPSPDRSTAPRMSSGGRGSGFCVIVSSSDGWRGIRIR